MTRREMREHLFCLVFQNEFYPAEEFAEQRDNYLQEKTLSDKETKEILDKLEAFIEYLPEIDKKITVHSKGWKIDRIAKAELALLRLAVYEALYDDSVPVGVAVNEAVELAKQYGEENAAGFVNGILGKIVNE